MWFCSKSNYPTSTSADAPARSKKRRGNRRRQAERALAGIHRRRSAVILLNHEALETRCLLSGVSLTPSEAAPQLVGEPITWTATVNDGPTAGLVYQFREGAPNGPMQVVRDFSADNHFTSAPMQEGDYRILVTVKQGFAAADAESAVVRDEVDSRVTGNAAVITPLANPLVALYSAPPVSSGAHDQRMHVEFSVASAQPAWRSTEALRAEPGKSTNFIVAGMLPDTTYEMRHVLDDGTASSPLLFTTGTLPSSLSFPTFTEQQPPAAGSDLNDDMVFHQLIRAPSNAPNPLATDLQGQVEWYYDTSHAGLSLTFAGQSLVPGGTVLLIGTSPTPPLPGSRDILREIDLAGNTIRETSLDAVNAQLTALGQDVVHSFTHDVERLPDGSTAVVGLVERTVNINGVPTNYVGNMIVVLNKNLQVTWVWNAFDHLDVNRGPVLGEIIPPGSQGPTASVPLLPAVDWLHLNAVSWSPSDGNLVLSVRHQDWVLKIDYRNGDGDGHIIWRLGQGGDFTVNSTDPNPWFSHQHNAHFVDDTTMVLFDNGNTRHASDPNAHSRGQVWKLNEQTMTATLVLNADLGRYSGALGAAQRLANGDYSFTLGENGPEPPRPPADTIEVTPDGTEVYDLRAKVPEYRAFRIDTLYAGTGLPTGEGQQDARKGDPMTNAQPASPAAVAVDAALGMTSAESSDVEFNVPQIGIWNAPDHLAISDLAALVAGSYPSTSDDDVFDDFTVSS